VPRQRRERAGRRDHDVGGVDVGSGDRVVAAAVADAVGLPQTVLLERADVAHGELPRPGQQRLVMARVQLALEVGHEAVAGRVRRGVQHAPHVLRGAERRLLAQRPADHVDRRRIAVAAHHLGVAGADHQVAVDVLGRLVHAVPGEHRAGAVRIQEHGRARRLVRVDHPLVPVVRVVEVDQQQVGHLVDRRELVTGAGQRPRQRDGLAEMVLDDDSHATDTSPS
jgi:hypothetical protein